MSPKREKGFNQPGVMHAGRWEAKAGQKAGGSDGQQHMEAHGGTDAAAPAFVRGASQPATASPFDRTHRHPGGIQDLIHLLVLVGPLFGQQAGHLFDELSAGVLLTHTLAVIGQRGESDVQMPLGEARTSPLAGEAGLLPEERQRDDFTEAEFGGRPSMRGQGQPMLLAHVIDHDREDGQKGIQVFHWTLLFQCLELP